MNHLVNRPEGGDAPPAGRVAVVDGVAVAALGLVSLVVHLAFVRRSGLLCDEAQFLWIVRMPAGEMLAFLADHESHPPLFYLMMKGWLATFGDGERAALALPIALGVALVPTAYLVGSRVFGRRTGLIAAALVSSAPLLIRYAARARPYSFLPLACLGSMYALWVGLRGGTWRAWAGYAATTLAMLLTHNWSWVVLAGQWAVAVPCLLRRDRRAARRGWAAAQAAIAAGFLPWVPSFLHQVRHAGYDAGGMSPRAVAGLIAREAISSPSPWGAQAPPGEDALAGSVVAGLVGGALACRALARRGGARLPAAGDGAGLGLWVFAGAPLAACLAAALYSSRSDLLNLSPMTTIGPCLLLVLAHAIANLGLSGRSPVPAVAAGLLAGLYLYYDLALCNLIRSNVREAAALVAERAGPADAILVVPQWYASPFVYYYRGAGERIDYPMEDFRGPIYYDETRARQLDPAAFERLEGRLGQARRAGRRLWLVMDALPATPEAGPDSWGLAGVRNYRDAAHIREFQVRRLAEALYGPPALDAVPREHSNGEKVRVLLYRPAPTPPSGG